MVEDEDGKKWIEEWLSRTKHKSRERGDIFRPLHNIKILGDLVKWPVGCLRYSDCLRMSPQPKCVLLSWGVINVVTQNFALYTAKCLDWVISFNPHTLSCMTDERAKMKSSNGSRAE